MCSSIAETNAVEVGLGVLDQDVAACPACCFADGVGDARILRGAGASIAEGGRKLWRCVKPLPPCVLCTRSKQWANAEWTSRQFVGRVAAGATAVCNKKRICRLDPGVQWSGVCDMAMVAVLADFGG